MLSDSNRVAETDKKIDSDISKAQLSNRLFTRLVAKGRRLTNVDFRYSIFDACYLRNCTFDSCDFTGCRFICTNLYGSSFVGCKFDYAHFERTIVDSDILESGCPGLENLKMKFARGLRMNYQQLGDAKAANKAIGVELQATEVYLKKAWSSNESYYRKKYSSLKRIKVWFEWVQFKALDWVWGNGESTAKLFRTVMLIFVAMAAVDVLFFKDAIHINSFTQALCEAPQIFLGTLAPGNYPNLYLTGILFVRLVVFGFFMSIIIKRFNRR